MSDASESVEDRPEIRQLDDRTIQRIAAGEVVERPASVVKELVENSLDAGATRVSVAVESGGKEGIRVRDDGVGMTEADLEVAVQEHTTSKIRDSDDLDGGVGTLGFRGEALYTVAGVSRLTVRSKPRGSAGAGAEIAVEGGEPGEVRPAGCPEGTTVEVEDLFFNTPARKKFLKRDATEFDHVNTVVTQYALANPDIAVSLEHGGRELFATEGNGDLRSAVLAVYGREVAESMVDVEVGPESPGASGDAKGVGEGPVESVRGLVSHPETTRSGRDYLATFVNGRYVTSRVLREAVVDAYGGQLAPDRYPFAVLFVEVSPAAVDVNVHPRKMEVRFDEESAVRSTVEGAVERALLDHGLIRSSAPRGRSAPEETEVTPESDNREVVGGAGTEHERASGVSAGRSRTGRSPATVPSRDEEDGADGASDADDTGDADGTGDAVGAVDAAGADEEGDEREREIEADSGVGGKIDENEPEVGANEPEVDESRPDVDGSPAEYVDDGWAVDGLGGTGIAPDRSRGGAADDRTDDRNEEQVDERADERSTEPAKSRSSAPGHATDRAGLADRPSPRRWQGAFGDADGEADEDGEGERERTAAGSRRLGPTTQRTLDGEATSDARSYEKLPRLKVLGQLYDTYVVAETESGLVLVDQHAADERVNYERLRRAFAADPPAQALAEPATLELTAREAALFEEYDAELADLGFEAERADERRVEVRSVPAVFDAALDPGLLRDTLTAFVEGADGGRETVDDVADELLADLACYPSVTGNTSLTEGSVVDLLSALDDCENPYACPHGRPTIIEFGRDDIEDRFERDYPGHVGRRADWD